MKLFDVSDLFNGFQTFMRSLFPPDLQDPPPKPLPIPPSNNKPRERRRPTVYIASPYTLGCTATNVRTQLSWWCHLWDMGYAPYAPLLNHFIALYGPRLESVWLESDLIWLRKCDAVLRLPGESKGADAEVAEAKRLGIPVVRSLSELQRITSSHQLAPHETVQDDYDWS